MLSYLLIRFEANRPRFCRATDVGERTQVVLLQPGMRLLVPDTDDFLEPCERRAVSNQSIISQIIVAGFTLAVLDQVVCTHFVQLFATVAPTVTDIAWVAAAEQTRLLSPLSGPSLEAGERLQVFVGRRRPVSRLIRRAGVDAAAHQLTRCGLACALSCGTVVGLRGAPNELPHLHLQRFSDVRLLPSGFEFGQIGLGANHLIVRAH